MGVTRIVGAILRGPEDVAPEAWIVDGRLTYMRPAGAVDETLAGVVLPGLVDMHCHVGLDPGGAVEPDLALKQAFVDRDAGTLLIRDAGSPSNTSFLHDRPDAPRLIRAGRFIARPKRYLRGYAVEIEVDDLVDEVVRQARAGDGWVKIIADWIDRDGSGDLEPLWPGAVLAEAIAAAHSEGARVTAHTFSRDSIDPLLDAGIDCLEHGTGMTEAHMSRAALAGVPVVPTLLQISQFESFAALAGDKYPAFAARMRHMGQRRFAHVRAMRDAGITLLMGTDAGGTISHGSLPDEAAEWVAAGLTPAEAVAASTWSAREFLGMPGLDEGASADLVVYAEDPRADVSALARPLHIVLRGVRVGP